MEKEKRLNNVLKCIFFLLYFIILSAERLRSVIFSFKEGLSLSDALNVYMIILALIALIGSWAYLFIFGRNLFDFKKEKSEKDFKHISIAAGISLLGGMVHTPETLSPVQFISYGCLIVSMVIFTAEKIISDKNIFLRILSIAYIVSFSMAIPVVYETNCTKTDCVLCNIFYPVECIVSVMMVIIFTFMLINFFRYGALSTFCPYAFIIALIGDAAVIALRLHDKINLFVLIFIILSVILGIIGKCITHFYNKKS